MQAQSINQKTGGISINIEPSGSGTLAKAYEWLKENLRSLSCFDEKNKNRDTKVYKKCDSSDFRHKIRSLRYIKSLKK